MNADMQKINSLVTAIKMAEKELDKQVTKETELRKKDDEFRKERDELKVKFAELEAEINTPAEDEELKILEAEYEHLEKALEEKGEEKALVNEIDEIEKKIKDLEKNHKMLAEDVEAIQAGTYNWKIAEVELADNPEENLKKREQLAKKITVERDSKGRLTVRTIQQLIDGCLEYYKPKFIILAERERKERRKYIDETKKWIDVSLGLFEDIDKTTDESQKEFLDILGIDFNDFNTEVENYCKEGNHQVLILMTMIPQKMKSMLKSNKNLTKEQIKEVMRYQISLVIDEIPKLIPNLPMPNPMDPNFNPEKIALLVNNRVNDLMWKKFKVEEEDFIEAMKKPSVANDFEINQLAMQMEMMMMQMAPNPGMMGGPDMGGMGGMGGFPGMPGMF